MENQFLLFGEMRAGFELRKILELRFGDAFFSANGRVDVNSKGAADHGSDLELGKLFQVHGDEAVGGRVEIHAHSVSEILWIVGADAHAERDMAEAALCEPEDDAG